MIVLMWFRHRHHSEEDKANIIITTNIIKSVAMNNDTQKNICTDDQEYEDMFKSTMNVHINTSSAKGNYTDQNQREGDNRNRFSIHGQKRDSLDSDIDDIFIKVNATAIHHTTTPTTTNTSIGDV